MRVLDGERQPGVLVISVASDGTVRASLGRTAIMLEPAEVSRLVDLYREAQAAALIERGRW